MEYQEVQVQDLGGTAVNALKLDLWTPIIGKVQHELDLWLESSFPFTAWPFSCSSSYLVQYPNILPLSF